MSRDIDVRSLEEIVADNKKAEAKATKERAAQQQRAAARRRKQEEQAAREQRKAEEQAAQKAEERAEHQRQLQERMRLASEAARDLLQYRNSPLFDMRVRGQAALLDGISMGDLRCEIDRLAEEQDAAAVRSVEPEIWPEPVDGDQLLDDLCDSFRRFVDAGDDMLAALSLWTCHSYVFDTWNVTPRLHITSQTPGCGKSTTLDILKLLVYQPEWSDNISTAAFATLANHRGTILLDEFDHAPRAIVQPLHSGAKRGGTRTRMQSRAAVVKQSYFTPVCLSGIGELKSEPLQERSIRLEQFKSEKRDNELPHFNELVHAIDYAPLRQRTQRFLYDNEERLKELERTGGYSFSFPPGCDHRFKDKWRPLLAISQIAGPDWLKRTQDIMNRYYKETLIHDPTHQLLSDVYEIFEASGKDRLFTEDILKSLHDISDREWDDYEKKGRGITAAEFARIVKPEIRAAGGWVREKKNKNLRIGHRSAAGYYRREFEAVWAKYGIGVTGSQNELIPVPERDPKDGPDGSQENQAQPLSRDPVTPALKPIRRRTRGPVAVTGR